jgi:hypothetical protein
MMRPKLPSITIKTDDPEQFCKAAARIASSHQFLAANNPRFPDIENLRFAGVSPHCGLTLQFEHSPSDGRTVYVHVRAAQWTPDPPSYDEYRKTAELLIKPILKEYNQANRRHLRLNFQSKASLSPKLAPVSRAWFERFTNFSNKSGLNYSDWRRFYDFIEQGRTRFSEEDMRHLLMMEGFPVDVAEDIANAYAHICDYRSPRSQAETLDFLHFKMKQAR